MFGETTTQASKVLAFRHFLHMITKKGPMLLLQVDVKTETMSTDNTVCRLLRNTNVTARQLLRCVYHQWVNLEVTVDANNDKTVLSVEGKQSDEKGGEVFKDDVRMAFSIGMIWCSRFTNVLPDNEQRQWLVAYMRRLTETVEEVFDENLKTAGIQAAIQDRVAFRDRPEEQETYVPIVERRMPPAEERALVVVTAVTHAMVRAANALGSVVRRLILGFRARGYQTDLGYQVQVVAMRRPRPPTAEQRFWQEQCLQRLFHSGGKATDHRKIWDTFSTTIHVLRFVCGNEPGPRFSWPGRPLPSERSGKTTRDG